MSLSDRVSDLFKRTQKGTDVLKESVVQHDRLDDGVLDDMVDRAAHFRNAMFDRPEINLDEMKDDEGNPIELTDEQREKAKDYTFWEDLFGDTFRALHTYEGPELENQDSIKPSRELNRRIMQQVISSDAFEKIRPQTRHDDMSSAFTAMSMTESLREMMSNELQEFILRAQQMGENEEQIENAQEALDALRDQIAQQGGAPTPQQKQAMQQAAQQKSQARGELAQQAAQQQTQGMGVDVMEAINEAVEDANESAQMISQMPGTEPGTGERMSPDQMLELAEKWKANPEMKQIAQMVGRMQRDIRYKRTNRIVGGREEIIDVKLGDDLPLLLPIEKMKLRNPLLRRDFIRRYYERSLVQYETQGYAEAGRGPVIVCIDGSGSMQGMENIWARSVALSLIVIAKREKRDAAAVEFSSSGQVQRWDFFANEPISPEKVLDFSSHFFNGGTDITQGLTSSKELIDTVAEFKKADVVLATDGHDYYREDDEELRREFVERGIRIHGVAIGMESNEYLEKMCESVVSAWDLAGSNTATDHLAEVIS
jgi:uncharacterized protein with von Willebrand factor type A (vWA) domain